MSEVKTNKISSLASNNDITIDPDGTGNTIIASGNVGIGTTTPAGANGIALTVNATTNPRFRLTSDNTGTGSGDGSGIFLNNSDMYISNEESAPMIFRTSATERMRIDSDGHALFTLATNATGKFADNISEVGSGNFCLQVSNSSESALKPLGFRAEDIRFATGSARRMYIDENGHIYLDATYANTTGGSANVHIGTSGELFRSTSSQRYKNTIADATHGLTELLALRPVTYKHNGNGDTVFGGLIAEEVHDAGLTEFVDYSQDADGNDQPEALHYANMVSLCIKAIQEQQATITALTARIEALEAE